LFSEGEDGASVADPELLNRLVNEKLQTLATAAGADGKTQEAVVAGVLMNRKQFTAFQAGWGELLARHNLTALHMKDFGLHGKYSQLMAGDRASLFSGAASLINAHKIYSVAATVHYADYRKFVSAEIQAVMSVYGFCFLLSAWTNHLLAEQNNFQKRIGFILDSGNPYAEHVRASHAALLKWQRGQFLHMGSLLFEDDKRIAALQAADVVAWSVQRRATGMRFTAGFEPLLGLFDESHSEQAWTGPALQVISDEVPGEIDRMNE
jgi:hypothetical protein